VRTPGRIPCTFSPKKGIAWKTKAYYFFKPITGMRPRGRRFVEHHLRRRPRRQSLALAPLVACTPPALWQLHSWQWLLHCLSQVFQPQDCRQARLLRAQRPQSLALAPLVACTPPALWQRHPWRWPLHRLSQLFQPPDCRQAPPEQARLLRPAQRASLVRQTRDRQYLVRSGRRPFLLQRFSRNVVVLRSHIAPQPHVGMGQTTRGRGRSGAISIWSLEG